MLVEDDDQIEEDAALIAGAFLSGYSRQMTAVIRDVAKRNFTTLTNLKRALKAEGLTIVGFKNGTPDGLDDMSVVTAKVRPILASLSSIQRFTSGMTGPITNPAEHPKILAKLLAEGDDDATDVAIVLMAEFRGKSGNFGFIKERLEAEGLAKGPGNLDQVEFEQKLRAILDDM